MTDVLIQESGMQFGPFSSDCCFIIEKSETYKQLNDRIKMAEFLLLRLTEINPPMVYVV